MPTANGMEARAMPHNIMPVTHTLASKQRSLILNLQTQPQNGAFREQRGSLLFKATTAPPTLPHGQYNNLTPLQRVFCQCRALTSN